MGLSGKNLGKWGFKMNNAIKKTIRADFRARGMHVSGRPDIPV